MTPQQEANEHASIEAFVTDVVRQVRLKGVNASVTCVILVAARAAADMTARDETGAIQREEASKIFQVAVQLMGSFE